MVTCLIFLKGYFNVLKGGNYLYPFLSNLLIFKKKDMLDFFLFVKKARDETFRINGYVRKNKIRIMRTILRVS